MRRTGLIALWTVFLACAAYWACRHQGWLFDPLLQNDDAYIWLFPFHRYGPEKALAEDPIASEKLAFVPPGVRLLYRVLVPATGLYSASKAVQGLCLGIVFLAGFLLARSKKGGLAAGILLVFFVLYNSYMVNRIAGGLARSFAFPCLVLWSAGAVSRKEKIRRAAILLGALTYPVTMALMLASEGFLILLRSGSNLGKPARRWGRLFLLALACGLLVLPYALSTRKYGRSFSLQEAEKEPAFGKKGRLGLLPMPGPSDLRKGVDKQQRNLRRIFSSKPFPEEAGLGDGAYFLVCAVLILILAGLIYLFSRTAAPPREALALLFGAAFCYALSRYFAFHFFLPKRHFEYAGPVLFLLLALYALRRVGLKLKAPSRAAWRNLAAAGFMAVFALAAKGSVRTNNGMAVNEREHSGLYSFVRSLPEGSRIASHPMDADGIPYWTGRANVGTFETLLPFAVESWQAQRKKTEDTLRALYAEKQEEVISYCGNYGVTHLLLNKDRYGPGFKEKALSFEPFSGFARQLLSGKKRKDLALTQLPKEAVLFHDDTFLVVEAERLRSLWKTP